MDAKLSELASKLMEITNDMSDYERRRIEEEQRDSSHAAYIRGIEDDIRHRAAIEKFNATEAEAVAKERAAVAAYRSLCLAEERRSNNAKERIATALERIAGSAPDRSKP